MLKSRLTKANSGGESTIEGAQLMATGSLGVLNEELGECFLVEVQQRDAATLLPIISTYIRPGSIVYSDEWRAYSQLATTTGCQHNTVNHSLHFVDPATGAHTQNVESMWASWKRMLREEHAGRNADLFPRYLPEFM